jgi:hypothetical protein
VPAVTCLPHLAGQRNHLLRPYPHTHLTLPRPAALPQTVWLMRSRLALCACAGDKPELLYPEAAAELSALGYSSTLDYVAAAAAAVLQQTGLIPHINAGVMDQPQLQR